ncbi:tetratricopeptide repeat protein [Candidatus Poseidoniaceae archaeon]|nr:tetratricopeptide repeat protein [Candidatus Poseidoniaceae archaeon]
MSDDFLQTAIDLFNQGNLDGAIEHLESMLSDNPDNAQVHHMYAEFANMKNSEAQEDVIPGRKIMMMYKKAMELDEENMEYIADFASFALECRRIPVAVKEFQRYARRLELEDIPIDEILFTASRNIVDAIEVMDPSKKNPMVQPWLQQALIWAVGGLGYSKDEAVEMITREI